MTMALRRSSFGVSIDGPRQGQSKKWGMPVCVPNARYSLVKGERIVRFVLRTWLHITQSVSVRTRRSLYKESECECSNAYWMNGDPLYVGDSRWHEIQFPLTAAT